MKLSPLLSLLALTSALAAPLSAQAFNKLNPELASWANGSVAEFVLSADGEWVTYTHHEGSNESDLELYSVPFDLSGPRVHLTASFVNSTNIRDVVILPDNDTVVFRANEEGSFEIYHVPIDGSSAPVSITPGLSTGLYHVHPDGLRVIYNASVKMWVAPIDGSSAPMIIGDSNINSIGLPAFYTPDNQRALYSVNLNGHPALYSSPLDTPDSWIDHTSNWVTGSVLWSPYGLSGDGQFVLFKMGMSTSESDLFTSPIDGSSAPAVVNTPVDSPAEEVKSFLCSPVGNQVVYRSNHQNFSKYQLYSRPADLSTPEKKLSGAMPSTADVEKFAISPDGQHVIYEADTVTNGVFDLWATGITGGSITQLNSAYAAGGDTTNFVFFPDSQWVLFRADAIVDGRQELFAVPVDGSSSAVHLNASGPSAGFSVVDCLAGANGNVLFRASSPDGIALYSVPRDGSSAPVRVSGPNGLNGSVWYDYQFSEDGGEILYRSDELFDNHFQIFGKSVGSAQPRYELSDLTVYSAGDVLSFEISPDSQWVVYEADQNSDNFYELFTVPIGGGAAVPIADIQIGNSYLGEWAISDDSQWVVFEGNRDYASRLYIYRVPIDGSSSPVRVNQLLPSTTNYDVYEWSLAGPHVIYTIKELTAFGQNIYTRPLDFSGPEIRLNPQQANGGGVQEFLVSPTGTHVVYQADIVFSGRDYLFAAPIDGSAAGVQLHPAPNVNGDVYDYTISPDGTRVAFTFDLAVDGEYHVYQSPIDASVAAIQVSHSLSTGDGDSYNPKFSTDSSRINYLAYEDAGVEIMLHSVDLTGTGHALLTPSTVPGGDVVSHAPAPGGRALYLTDQMIDGHVDLHIIDDQAATSAINLHPGLPVFADVTDFMLHPDGQQVLYLADDLIEGDYELFSNRLDGSSSPFRQSGVMAIAGDANLPHAFLHGRPIYRADQSVNGKFEVFWRMIRNTADTPRLNAPLHSNGDVSASALSSDQKYFVYLADQDEDGVVELYSRELVATPAQKP